MSQNQISDLLEMLQTFGDIDKQTFNFVTEILLQKKVSDSLKFLSKYSNQIDTNDDIFVQDDLQHFDKWWKLDALKKNIKKIISVLQKIDKHDFNKINYFANFDKENKDILITKISNQAKIINFFRFLVNLTRIDYRFIQSGSNSLHLLVEMKTDLRNQNFENIRIKNTSLIGANLVRCDLSGSEFDQVIISGMILNQAKLFNCKWRNLRINELNQLKGHHGSVNSISFSPDGKSFASCSDDKSIRLWEVRTGKIISMLEGENKVCSVFFSPNGTTIASCNGKFVSIWNLKKGKQILKLNGQEYVNCVCFSPDGTILASGSKDQSICLWDVKTGQLKAHLDCHFKSICFSPDGTTLASCSDLNSIRLWDVKTGQLIESYVAARSNYQEVWSVCFSPDCNKLASGCSDNSIYLWEFMTRQQIVNLRGHQGCVFSLCFSPNSNTLASGSLDKSIRLWDVKTRQQIVKFNGHSSGVLSVCFSPDGTILASGSKDQSICLWDVKTGQQKAEIAGQAIEAMSVSFQSNVTTIAPDSLDKYICIQGGKTSQQIAKFNAHLNGILQVCFSPDGTILASGSIDNSIRLWDVKTGQQKAKIDGHSEQVKSFCFSRDGTTLAFSIDDHSIRLWDVNTAIEILPQDNIFNGLISQFEMPLQSPSILQNGIYFYSNIDHVILRKCKNQILQAKGALILKGKFVTQQGFDLRYLFKSKGSFILENQIQQKKY
ncbi:unnamed protein product [Paramecium octaurelia]|uniref:WD-40 repeat protein n=1 Tax=Paramecium octaurelia TaxID=43137 RepID=A0A8S1X4Q9_PAROT|nr:unnamed protein product [Paramecium octaurelia]